MRGGSRVAALATGAALAVLAAGCSSPGGGGPAVPVTGSATPTVQGGVMTGTALPSATGGTATATRLPTGRTIEVTVHGSTVTPTPAKVDVAVGQPVTLRVTSDRSTELHLHGVEVEQPVTAGVPTTVLFVAPRPGVYEVELHDPELRLLDLVAR